MRLLTRMDRLETSIEQTQQAVKGAFRIMDKRAVFHRKTMYTMHSATLIGIVYHVVHSFGWW